MLRLIGVVIATLAFSMSMAAKAASPFYVSGSFGGYFRESASGPDIFSHTDTPDVRVSGTDKLDFNAGEIVNLALGYRLSPHLRVEGEFGYTTYTGSSLNPFTTAAGFPNLNGQTFDRSRGDRYSRYTGTANAFYDFSPVAGLFTPYIGGGVGGSHDHQDVGHFTAANDANFRSSGGSSTQGLAMVEGGVSIRLTPQLSLVPAYRYVHFFAGNEDVAHVAKIGLRYQF